MRLSTFTRAYLECCLFTDTDETEEPLDRNYSIENFDAASLERAKADCAAFQEICSEELADISDESAGHDFWVTRNGHGVGFWDRGYPKEINDRLSETSKRFGEVWSQVYGDEDPGENIELTAGHDPAALLARYRPVVPFESAETDVAVECLIHRVCAVVALGLDV